MYLEISLENAPGGDLGYLLHKNPNRVHTLELSFGMAHIYFSESTSTRSTVCVFVEVDPIALVRRKDNKKRRSVFALEEYTNDRPYAASSFLSVTLAKAFSTTMSGRCKDKPELATTPLTFETRIPAFPARDGGSFVRRLFEPLGYECNAQPLPLAVGNWQSADSRYVALTLRRTCTLRELLNQLYVLIPVCDNAKHYYVGDDEVEKILRHGGTWLAEHPEHELIVATALKKQSALMEKAGAKPREKQAPNTPTLRMHRANLAIETAQQKGIQTVCDLGCGTGFVLERLLRNVPNIHITGVDVSLAALQRCRKHLEQKFDLPALRSRWSLKQSSLLLRDPALVGFDLALVLEVVEHIEPERLPDFRKVLFEHMRPARILLTSPNAEYNVRYAKMEKGNMRHSDHRFEWTRAEFETWCQEAAQEFGYTVLFSGCGEQDDTLGAPTLVASFTNAQAKPQGETP